MNMSRRGKIPDRWEDYSPINEVIQIRRLSKFIKIVPFKVPLPRNELKWTPADVMRAVPNLGLVIDLNFKNPGYYESREFLDKGINYIKIGCKGLVIPHQDTFQEFCAAIDNFHQNNPDLVVGVHCTHGINRTGYMICRYMVERCGYSASNALETFAKMRGYKVERVNYCQHLQQLEKQN